MREAITACVSLQANTTCVRDKGDLCDSVRTSDLKSAKRAARFGQRWIATMLERGQAKPLAFVAVFEIQSKLAIGLAGIAES